MLTKADKTARGMFLSSQLLLLAKSAKHLRTKLQNLEKTSGKGIKKWTKSTQGQRLDYIRGILSEPDFIERLFYARFTQTTNYSPLILHTISRSLVAFGCQSYAATILIDGLVKKERQRVAVGLRRLRVSTRKVRGLKDESDEFIRLADALAGFIRDSLEASESCKELFEQLSKKGWLQEV